MTKTLEMLVPTGSVRFRKAHTSRDKVLSASFKISSFTILFNSMLLVSFDMKVRISKLVTLMQLYFDLMEDAIAIVTVMAQRTSSR